ncbi:accessory Sec system translocase SecA2 [Leucobacter viscericola]|uniref:Protein translocase subunit SecA n=1 Tax=Leucobacter viscericola TaxID=2714935 RepID=A0A6G7XDI1_9MICO|nr:accessory Sec system translocase SecA2 [Leucobacter viscericola]QIK62670.1 accessory Sec system translocase SecA2 [Leucobacter viscericola]
MSNTKPQTWASRLLGKPGSVSFKRFAKATPFTTEASQVAAEALGLQPFSEQQLATRALLAGHAIEMDTGEGKTLVGALAAAGHVQNGRSVHVLSVNDYLARRDAEWMGPFYAALNMTVAWIGQQTSHAERQRAYQCDVVYAPVSEIGFDVLRDRFAVSQAARVNPTRDVAIVDEADAVMIDEAMVPLVLAGSSGHVAEEFTEATHLVAGLEQDTHFVVSSDRAVATLTDEGLEHLEGALGGISLYAAAHMDRLTAINLALHARVALIRDVDYLVENGSIRLINASRGRVSELQRWPDGLHAALEAKEGLAATPAGVVLDTMTVHELLRGYETLSGMSGTILAVAEELEDSYGLKSGRIERHVPNQRVDEPDRVFLTEAEKWAALVDEISRRHGTGQPILVGTRSVAESEQLAERLREAAIPNRLLNAKNDAEEATVIAKAGEYGAVTISTQMSGRGTDIRLGGPDEHDRDRVVSLGGLAVLAAGRDESGRLDAQLRGRSGRQGDPGSSTVFVSLEDDLVQHNAPDHLLKQVEAQGDALAPRDRRQIVDTAQRIAEGIRQDRHRATQEYNRAISEQRATVLAVRDRVEHHGLGLTKLGELIPEHLAELDAARGEQAVAETTRLATLHFLDSEWTRHLAELQEVRDGIHLRSLGGQDPVQEFHITALRAFEGFFDAAFERAAEFMLGLSAEDVGKDVEELGLIRPSATWTYMTHDDPFGSTGDRFARNLGRLWRTRVMGAE